MRIARRASKKMTARARAIRSSQTDVEALLWAHPRGGRLDGRHFRRQQPLGRYILDFYCHQARLAVELDGGQHVERLQSLRDRERDQFCEAQGVLVLRFFNDQVLRNLPQVLAVIDGAAAARLGRAEPSP
jgi:very-short-patch-repair endonuclease